MSVEAPRAIGDPRDAIAQLTRLPLAGNGQPAAAWFPSVGIIVAGVAVAVRYGVEPLLGVFTATIVAVLASIVMTGAYHEDGLADSADGLWGGATPERRLQIMHDSRLGTFGVTAIVGDVALRVALLASVDTVGFIRAMLASEVAGRFAPLVLAATMRAVAGSEASQRARPRSIPGWVVASLALAAAVWLGGGVWSPALLAAAAAGMMIVRRTAHRRLGGINGDVLGACVRVCALLVMAATVALHRHGA